MDEKEIYRISTVYAVQGESKRAVSESYSSREAAERAIPSHIRKLEEGKDKVVIIDIEIIGDET